MSTIARSSGMEKNTPRSSAKNSIEGALPTSQDNPSLRVELML